MHEVVDREFLFVGEKQLAHQPQLGVAAEQGDERRCSSNHIVDYNI
jgi:hypothetical protein